MLLCCQRKSRRPFARAIAALMSSLTCAAHAQFFPPPPPPPPPTLQATHVWLMDDTSTSTLHGGGQYPVDGAYRGDVNVDRAGHTLDSRAVDFRPGYAAIDHVDSMAARNGALSFWYQDTGRVRGAGLISKDANGFGDGGHLTVRITAHQVVARIQGSNRSVVLRSDVPVVPDAWTFVSVGWGKDGFSLSLNDEEVAWDEYAGGLRNNSESLIVGGLSIHRTPGLENKIEKPFGGLIDDVRFYNFDNRYDPTLNLGAVSAAFADRAYAPSSLSVVVPEPSSLALLALGALCLIPRNRRV